MTRPRRASIAAAVGLMASAAWYGVLSAQQSNPSYTGQRPAQPQDSEQPGQGGQMQQERTSPGPAHPPGSAQQEQDRRVLGSAFTARVTGEVQQVDRQTGHLTLNGTTR